MSPVEMHSFLLVRVVGGNVSVHVKNGFTVENTRSHVWQHHQDEFQWFRIW
jgi:hypothetical protein